MSSVQDMLDELSDHGFEDTGVPRKLAMLNDTVADISSREPWPFLEATVDLNFDGTSPVPSNFPADFRAALVLVRSDTGQALEWKRADVMYREHGSEMTKSGDPLYFYFIGKELRVWQAPSASTGLVHMPYIRTHPTLLQSDTEDAILIPPQHHRVIVLGTLYKLYDMEDDFDLAQRFQAEYEARLATMRSELWVSQYDRPDRIYDIDTDLYEFIY